MLAAFLLWLFGGLLSSANTAADTLSIKDALTTESAALVVRADPGSTTRLRDVAAAHGLLIGAATEAVTLVREPDFASLLGNQFSLLTTENRLKFNIVHPSRDIYNFEQADVIVRFAEANRMAVRGHCFIWHEHFPSWLAAADISTTEAEQLVREHIHKIMQRYAGRILYWDVVNEPITDDGKMRDTKWRSLLGDDYIAKAFRWAREADPHAKLFLNDFGIETVCPKSDKFYEVVQGLQAAKIPLDGLGFQMHLNLGAGLSTTSLQQNLRRFAALGLELHVTEMDVSLDRTGVASETLQRQAAMYRDVLETTLEFPAFKAIVFWGASDRHSWLTRKISPPDAPLLFDRELRPKPAFDGVLQALQPG